MRRFHAHAGASGRFRELLCRPMFSSLPDVGRGASHGPPNHHAHDGRPTSLGLAHLSWLLLTLILIILVACADSSPTETGVPRQMPQFSEMVSDTPPTQVCGWMNCRGIDFFEYDYITEVIANYQSSDPFCHILLHEIAYNHVSQPGKFYIGETDFFTGGPLFGDSFHGAYHHNSGTMFVNARYLGSPGELIRYLAHEAGHAFYGPNSESSVLSDVDPYCPPA